MHFGQAQEVTKKMQENQKMCEKLTNLNIKTLHYQSTNGTDLTVELPENAIWCGGSSIIKGREPIVNMPTEEVFSMPKRDGVNGVVVSTKPLSLNGQLVENFKITFKDGKAVEVEAEKGLETLKGFPTPGAAAHLSLYNFDSLEDFDMDFSNNDVQGTINFYDCTKLKSFSAFKTIKTKYPHVPYVYIYRAKNLTSLEDFDGAPVRLCYIEDSGIKSLKGLTVYQDIYNKENGIIPRTIIKSIKEVISNEVEEKTGF